MYIYMRIHIAEYVAFNTRVHSTHMRITFTEKYFSVKRRAMEIFIYKLQADILSC